MAISNSIKIADGLGPLTPKTGVLTLADFHGDQGIYESYLMMREYAESLDRQNQVSMVNESKRKQK